MSKVTITFEDNDKGTVSIKMEFDPVIVNKPGVMLTNAQATAMDLMDALKAKAEDEGGEWDQDEEEE